MKICLSFVGSYQIQPKSYRVSHSKVYKINWLWFKMSIWLISSMRCSWETLYFAYLTRFFLCCAPSIGWYIKIQNYFSVKTVWKLLSIFFQRFWGFLILFCFQPFISSKNVNFWRFVTFYYLKKAPKSQNSSLRNKRCWLIEP